MLNNHFTLSTHMALKHSAPQELCGPWLSIECVEPTAEQVDTITEPAAIGVEIATMRGVIQRIMKDESLTPKGKAMVLRAVASMKESNGVNGVRSVWGEDTDRFLNSDHDTELKNRRTAVLKEAVEKTK